MNKNVRKQKADLSKSSSTQLRPDLLSSVMANFLVFAVLIFCYWLINNNEALYNAIVQEDEIIEWSTAWAFLLASFGSVFGFILGNKKFKKFQWFYLGLSIFCFLVFMEEISWGQRLFGYLPPNYFLENNFQQEFTAHNVINDSFRMISVKVVILGYGVILPLLMQFPASRRFLNYMGVVVPPYELIPSFFAVFYIYQIYPWDFTGEVIELMLGMCFLFTVLFRLWDFKLEIKKSKRYWQLISVLGVALLSVGLSAGTVRVNNYKNNSPIKRDACYKELQAIEKDFANRAKELGRSPFKNYFHHRLYTVVKNNDFNWIYKGQFANLTKEGLNQDRADYFIDPWNMAYWLLYKYDKATGRKRIVAYSFGPNRKRDSDHWTLKGDDIGIILWDTGLKYPYISENEIVPKSY
ncbi:MAG: hypothetical protein HKP59_11230 [Lutibacter sp.]|uniref:hypothetical protein n=1 Tax=Lutibacter sp. TaxID=1925666 RepID=UPI0017A1BC49|nr:hypothetical protein [Lutibacter sp.]MBT8318184.1 hypothetical protein [Lutibacter sp.]NNJ59044.1 hypothetical protein [Lutibacter sp.]